jgi:ABC-type transporter Mla MlaB component
MFPQLSILGPVEAEIVCQTVMQLSTPTPGKPATRNQKLSDLGVTDAGILILVTSLVQEVKARNCTLDPNTLDGLTCGTLYGAMADLVEQASRP